MGGKLTGWHPLFRTFTPAEDVLGPLLRRVEEAGIRVMTGTEVEELVPGGVAVGGGRRITGDATVICSGFELFDASMAQEVMDFATRHADKPCITVHCNMGVSRSAAIALFLSEWQNRDLYQQGRSCLNIPDSYNRTVHRVLTNTWLGDAPSAFEM